MKGSIVYVDLVLSLIVLMHRSASGTCSFADVVLSWGKSTRRGSNSQSPRIEETINPLFSYIDVTFFRIFDNVFVCRFFKTSTVMNFMYLEIVMMKGILLTNMMSMHRVTLRYFSRMSRGTGSILSNTCFGGVLAVLPFSDPRFGPKILSAAIISDFDIGDFR